MDVDHFKQFNDTYGHQLGDKVLQNISQTLKCLFLRGNDYCFRLGGEEFGVVFKADDKKTAEEFVEKARASIEELNMDHSGNSASNFVTASFGLVCKNASEIINIDQIYKEADELLYKAKESGRNKVVSNS